MSDQLVDGPAACRKISMVQRRTFWELDFESEDDEPQFGRHSRARFDSDIEYCACGDEVASFADIVDERDEIDSICSWTTLEDVGSPTQTLTPVAPTSPSPPERQELADGDGTFADAETYANYMQCGSICWWEGMPMWNYDMQLSATAAPFAHSMSYVPVQNADALVPRNGAELARWHDQSSKRRSDGLSRQKIQARQTPKGGKGHSSSTASTSASDDGNCFKKLDGVEEQGFTTIIFRNLPSSCTRDVLTKTMDANGFAGCYDFVHVPVSFLDLVGLGYALVNMVDHDSADRAHRFFTGFKGWPVQTAEACEVGWSSSNQGLSAHIDRYRNSPLMHETVPRQYRPALFRNGVLGTFPGPTVRLRPPRVRHQKPSEQCC